MDYKNFEVIGADEVVYIFAARSWYDARAFARTKWPYIKDEDITLGIDHCAAPDYMAPGIPTTEEIAREHVESEKRKAYRKGRQDSYELAASLVGYKSKGRTGAARKVLTEIKKTFAGYGLDWS